MILNNLNEVCVSRLKTVLLMDKNENPQKIKNVIKSEIKNILKNYMELDDLDFDLSLFVNKVGLYELNIHCLSKRIILANSYLDI